MRAVLLSLGALAGLGLAACVSDEKAVEIGLATACDGKNTVSSVGDPSRRYVAVEGGESCNGPRRNRYDTKTLVLIDCTQPARLDIKVAQLALDTERHGANYDHSELVERQKARLRLGLDNLAGVQVALDASGVATVMTPGVSGEECTKRA